MAQPRNRYGRFSSPNKLELSMERMLSVQEGILADEMLNLVEQVVENAKTNIEKIMWRYPSVSDDVAYAFLPSENAYIIGIKDVGPISDYLSDKEEFEHSWLDDALEDALEEASWLEE